MCLEWLVVSEQSVFEIAGMEFIKEITLVIDFVFYHSMMELDLVVRRNTLPAAWRISSFTEQGEFPVHNLAFKFLKLV